MIALDAVQQFVESVLAEASNPCVTSSFQTEDMVVVHLARLAHPRIPVLFLETGYHFPETLAYRDRMAAEWDLNLINLSATQAVAEQESQFGLLHQTAPDQCCKLRKVQPLFAGLAPYDAWFTGLRREQSPTRANLQPSEPFQLPGGKLIRRVSPVYDWTRRDVWQYAKTHGIPELPLYEQGYTSIGCAPCTVKPLDPNDARSGRWQGKQKLECGIHIQAAG